ncbi:MAG: hypothetical protein E6Q97_15860 [Desulfurellales bacterium]|nr:MAG: hypothetical protein E6Q97_15860 [Desulfurellales bacterium]
MIPQHIIDQARTVDLVALIQRYQWPLKTESHGSKCGPCPFCNGGEDRFWVRDNRYKCRVCGATGTPVDFVMWRERMDFPEAVKMLTSYVETPETALNGVQNGKGYKDAPKPQKPQFTPFQGLPQVQPAQRKEPPTAQWIAEATAIAEQCHERLVSADDGQPGRDYLTGRGITESAWLAFGLGFHAACPLPGTNGKQLQSAICIPWQRGGKVLAIRYRFLKLHTYTDVDGKERKAKQTARPGSYFTDYLYGGHALTLPPCADSRIEALRTLILCEGELNALSIWQVAGGWRWDVLSVGSESQAQHITPAMIDYARKFERVICWMDRAEVAKAAMAQIPGSYGITSPTPEGSKLDANDMLKRGLLGGFLAEARRQACESDTERTRLYWNIMDAFDQGQLDEGALVVAAKLAGQLGLDKD